MIPDKMIEAALDRCPDEPDSKAMRAVLEAAGIGELIGALQEMVSTQREWEDAVARIIGRPEKQFDRAIDRAIAILKKCGVERANTLIDPYPGYPA